MVAYRAATDAVQPTVHTEDDGKTLSMEINRKNPDKRKVQTVGKCKYA